MYCAEGYQTAPESKIILIISLIIAEDNELYVKLMNPFAISNC